jgi:hypothetical protein
MGNLYIKVIAKKDYSIAEVVIARGIQTLYQSVKIIK